MVDMLIIRPVLATVVLREKQAALYRRHRNLDMSITTGKPWEHKEFLLRPHAGRGATSRWLLPEGEFVSFRDVPTSCKLSMVQ